MRLPILTLVLGVVIGFAVRPSTISRSNQYFASPKSEKETAEVRPTILKEPVYPTSEQTLALLKKRFDEAVVVVLADETYDDAHKLVRISVVEVWKGPSELAGKTMDSRLDPPLAYQHSDRIERVLKFMPMTPHLDTSESTYFTGEVLRMNPAFTVSSIKEALVHSQG